MELSQDHFSSEEIAMMKHIPIVLEQNRKKRNNKEAKPQKITLQSSENARDKGNERCKCHIL